MPSNKELLKRPDIWRQDLEGRLNRLHSAALEAEGAYVEVEERDAARERRQARRTERNVQQYPGLAR